MDKETLFKEFRQGRVLLWVGAGFSRYAGYPMGAAVVKKLYEELSKAQREELAEYIGQKTPECPDWPLPRFAQYFVDLYHGSRARLVEILDTLFSAEPSAMHVHEKLARISHIDHIVTTNYDPLFELAYRPSRIHVVGQASQIPQIGNKEVTLYKIHGQPSNPDSIIITEDDYITFADNADDMVWAHLRSLMSTRTIVFIGYAVEDPNILAVFDDLVKKLGKLMKPAYLVGPSMDRIRQERLLRNSIHFIKATGEDFVDELWAYIQDTAIAELPKDGLLAATQVGQMLKNLGLDFTMTVDGGAPLINKITRIDGPTNNSISFSSSSIELREKLKALESGESFKPVKIDIASLKTFSHTVEGFRLPVDNDSTFWIAQSPGWEGKVDVRFNASFMLTDVEVWAYGKNGKVHLVCLSANSRAEIIWSRTKGKGSTYTVHFSPRHKVFANIPAAIEHSQTLKALSESKNLEIFRHGQKVWDSNGLLAPVDDKMIKMADKQVKLVEDLRIIESSFGIFFKNFDITKQSVDEAENLSQVLRQQPILFQPKKQSEVIIENPTIEQLGILSNQNMEPGMTAVREFNFKVDFNILGWTLRIQWKQREHLLEPIFKKDTKGRYFVRSKVRKGVIEYLGIDEKEVKQSFAAIEPKKLTDSERIQERLPQD